MNVDFIVFGKLDKAFWQEAYQLYAKRLSNYCKFNLVELKDASTNDFQKNIKLESQALGELLATRYRGYYKVLLDLQAKNITSEELSQLMVRVRDFQGAKIVFIIGGSDGLTSEVKQQVDQKIAFGQITLPHQLCRIVLAEQVYRAFKIAYNETYHK